ncbi:ankyrin repeat domain-containing protein 26-like isoform X2 [Rana temporaria]|uniref:ankyrin repeat domain-containing protein 26-like isoform X2 n=1 Tax=Rana temporaria TaxID=8407 RepID=UPI001AADD879|nr:ankyrin repeat domain-containing protein 26-like isoform X2 [Rana temporaria]
MKKFFGIGKKKKSGPSPSPSESGSVLSVGYELKDKDLSKLHRATSAGDVPKIRQLLHKQDINQVDKENRTPLHLACANGHLDAVRLLVESKAKLNLCDNDSRTPLFKSIQCQHEHCATVLLEHDADPNVVDVNGNSAFHLAALIPSLAIANQLLEHGANINTVNKDGCTPLVLAATENHEEMVEFLIKEGADVNSKDKNGRTSLMVAAGNGQISLVKYLLQNNADIFVKDETGWTADDHAVMNGHHACSHLIIEHGSKNKRSSLYSGGKKGTSVFNSPDRVVEGGFALGSPAINKEELQVTSKQKSRKRDSEKGTDDFSQGDSESHVSGKADSWPSSDEDDLDFSPKITSKPNLTQLLSSKKKVNESFALQSKSDSDEDSFHDSEDEDANIPSPPKTVPEIPSFPQPLIFSPGSFTKPSQLASASLHSIIKEKSFSSDEGEDDNEGSESSEHSFTANTAGQARVQAGGDVGRKVVLMSELGLEDDDVESPWDSESASDSPRKQSTSDMPTPAAPVHMQCISEESHGDMHYRPCFLKHSRSCKMQDEDWLYRQSEVSEKSTSLGANKPQKTVLQMNNGSSTNSVSKINERNSKSDLMADLGLDDADDIEDASDWDSTSHSLKYSSHTPRSVAQSHHKLNESTSPQTILDSASAKGTAASLSVALSSVQEDDIEEHVNLKKDSAQSISKDVSQDLRKREHGLPNGKTIIKDQSFLMNEHIIMTSNFKVNPEPINQEGISQQPLENLPVMQNVDEKQESSDSDLPWEEKYENLWVDSEKKDVKSHFKDITAELKQKFGEFSKMKKKSPSKTSKSQEESSPGSQDLDKCIGQGAKTSGSIVMYPVSVEKDDKSLGNSESTDWSEDPKSKMQEGFLVAPNHGEKGSNHINLLEKEQKPFTFGVSNFLIKKNVGHPSALPTKGVGKSFLNPDFEKLGSASLQAKDKVGCVNRKESDVHPSKGYNQKVIASPHQLEEHLLQPLSYDLPTKHKDKQMEQDMRKFKNEVEREKTNINRQLDLEKSKRNCDTENDLQEKSHIQPKITSESNSYEGKNFRPSIQSGSMKDDDNISKVQKQMENGDVLKGLDGQTLSETSQKPGKRAADKPVDEKSKDNDDEDMDDFSQSSGSVTEEYEVPTSAFRNAMLLIEQLNLEGQDSVNVLKMQNIIHEYERVIEKENQRHVLLAQEVKKLREERKEIQQMTEKNRELKSLLEYNKVEWDSDISSLRSSLKQEEEKRKSAEMLHDMSKEQFRRKEEQCRHEIEEKQQLELTLRNLELEMRSLRNSMKQVEEERNESQRLHTQEHNARLLQEEALNNLRRRNEEEDNKKRLAKSVEQVQGEPSETNVKVKDLTQKNITLEEEIYVLKQELEQVRSRYQEEESRYLDENECLKEKNDDLRKDLKVNEETLTQTVIQCNAQLNALKTETNLLCSKLEHEKQGKERLETELESVRSRLNSALQDLERSQISKTDAERTLQRERDDWLRSKDKLNHDLSSLRESHNNLSQQLSRAEAKSNTFENDLHRTGLSLQEKTLLFESSQRDLKEAQNRIKDLERSVQVEKDQTNKSSIKQETMQERLAQITSENMQLRQQLEEAQNKGIIKEKAVCDVQDRFTDIFSKLRTDTERQVQIVEERNKDLINKSNELREQIYRLETEKVERESSIRQLQQELADALKKLSMSEASLEVITRYRNDLEEEKQHLHKELERFRTKIQDLEEQFLQSERRNHQLKNLLDDKEREVIAAFQKVQELSSATAGSEKSAKQLEEHIQKLEIENAKIEATAKQQSVQIETLQKELQESICIRNRLEDLVTGLQTSKFGLEEKLNLHVHKQTVLSQNAQDSHNLWEEELKSRSRLGVRLAELDRSKADLVEQVESEKKKVRKLLDQKKSMEERFDQEMKRNNDLQREVSGLKKLLKATKKKLKDFENGQKQPISMKEGSYRGSHETDSDVLKLKEKIEELSSNLERESRKYIQFEASNRDLHEQLSSMKASHKNHDRLERSKRQLEEEVAELRRHIGSSKMDQSYMEQYKRELDERSRQELRQKLEEVNMFLQAQAASKDKLEQLRAENDTTVKNQLDHRIQDLESELNKIKNKQEENMSQKDSSLTELTRIKDMYAEEQKTRKSLASKLERANERLAEVNAKLLNERQRSKSLFASSFLNGSLNGNPLLDTSSLGGLGSNPALTRSLGLGGSFLNPVGSGFSANEMGAYFVKMQQELEKNITKELDQANAELDTGCARVSPVGSTGGSMRNLSNDQDLVSQARQQYLEVLKKNYKI